MPAPRERCGGGDEDGDGRIDEGFPLVPVGESRLLGTSRRGFPEWKLAVASTGTDIVVAWQAEWDREEPDGEDARLRWVNADLEPLGEALPLPSAASMTLVGANDGALLTHCRFSSDTLSRRLVGVAGELGPVLELPPEGADCAVAEDTIEIRSVVTDRAVLTAFVDGAARPDPGRPSWLATGDREGRSAAATLVESEAQWSPALAVAHGKVLHVGATLPTAIRSQLRVQGFSLEGEPLAEPRFVDTPGDLFFVDPWIVPTPNGFLVVTESVGAPTGGLIVAIDREGVPGEAQVAYPDLIRIDDVFPIPSGALMATIEPSEGRVVALDFEGRAETQWVIEDVLQMRHPHFVKLGEQLFVAFFRTTSDGVETRIQRLGCEP